MTILSLYVCQCFHSTFPSTVFFRCCLSSPSLTASQYRVSHSRLELATQTSARGGRRLDSSPHRLVHSAVQVRPRQSRHCRCREGGGISRDRGGQVWNGLGHLTPRQMRHCDSLGLVTLDAFNHGILYIRYWHCYGRAMGHVLLCEGIKWA